MADPSNVVLGVDIGTSETKAVAVDDSGRVIAQAERAHEASVPHPGWLEHDARDVWWRGLAGTVRDLLDRRQFAASHVAGVACSGIGPCVLPVDLALEPLRPAILYGVDGRASRQVGTLTQRLGRQQIMARCGNELSSQSAGPKILWLSEVEPEIHARTAYFLTCQSYVVARLTGHVAIDHTTGSYFHPLYDQRTQSWDVTGCEDFVRPEQLGELKWPSQTAGVVTAQASTETGLAPGTPVAVGTADAPAEALAAGTVNPGDMMVMYGSSSFMIQVNDEPAVGEDLWSAPYLFPGTWQRAGGTATAGAMTRWVLDILSADASSGRPDIEALALLAEESPPGARGLMSLPYLSGERTPFHDPHVRGMFAGLDSGHTRADIARAAIEGVAHSMAAVLDCFASDRRQAWNVTAVAGGIANHIWLQAVSDITGLRQNLGDRRGAAFGSAIIAALMCGMLASSTDIQRWTRDPTAHVEPNPEHAGLYTAAHRNFVELTALARAYARTTAVGDES